MNKKILIKNIIIIILLLDVIKISKKLKTIILI